MFDFLDFSVLIASLAAKYPLLVSLLFLMGALRSVFKPLFSLLQSYVDYTPNPADNAALARIQASKLYALIAYALDYAASIKLPLR